MTSSIQKLNIPLPKHFFTPLAHERMFEVIIKCISMVPTSGFEWVKLEQPEKGSIIIYKEAHEKSAVGPVDGYGWMDVEKKTSLKVNGKDCELFEKNMGFTVGDRSVSIKRRRYRILDPVLAEFVLLHYLPTDQNQMQVPVMESHIKEPPTIPKPMQQTQQQSLDPNVLRYQQQVEQVKLEEQMNMQNRAQAQQKMQQQHQQQQQQQQLAQAQAQSQAQQKQQQEIYGDEIDASSTRQLAMLRFKRNEGIFEEILSPYAIADITPPSLFPNASEEKAQEMQKLIDANRQKIKQLELKHKETVAKIQHENLAVFKAIDDLKKMDSNGMTFDQIQDDVEVALGVRYHKCHPKVRKREVVQ